MRQSTTDKLTRRVSGRMEQEGLSLAGKTVLCALSGGRDSTVLLHILLRLGAQQGFAVCAAHFNHKLRETAGRDESFVRAHCTSLGIPLTVEAGDVAAFARESGRSIEDAARELRYGFLQRTAREIGADFIATGHHRADNAETLLLHLLRGSGLKGLGGIPFARGNIIRPLLDADRAEIDACVTENRLPYVEDETNSDLIYTRNRIRLELLPLLEEIAPGSVSRIADTAALLRHDEICLQRQAEELMSGDFSCLSVPLLARQERAIAARMVRIAAQHAGTELTCAQTDALLTLPSGGCLTMGNNVRAAREGKTIRFYRLSPAPEPMKLTFGIQHWGSWRITVQTTDSSVPAGENTIVLRSGLAPLTVAAWDGTGRLTTETGKRTVKRLFADSGVCISAREGAPAIYTGGTLVAVLGAGTDCLMQGKDGAENISITFDAEEKA